MLSSDATPANSEPNTPRKQKKKNKKKVATPQATIVEDDSGAPMNGSDRAVPLETPSKTKYRKQGTQKRAAGNDLVAAEEATSSNNAPVVKGLKPPEVREIPDEPQAFSDPSIGVLQAAAEIKRNGKPSQSGDSRSDDTPTVSPRSQVPKKDSEGADDVPNNTEFQNLVTDKQPEAQRLSSPVSDADRPSIVDRISDSDHVDESFHTASASPPTDNQSQSQARSATYETPPSTIRTRKSMTPSEKRSTSFRVKKSVVETDEQLSRTDADDVIKNDSTSPPQDTSNKEKPISAQCTPTTPLPISVKAPTPPKKQSTNTPSDRKPPTSISQRSVSDPSRVQKTPAADEASVSQDNTTKRAEDLKNVPLAEDDKAGEDCSQALTAQNVASATSIPPTPTTAYHTAPTTPASIPNSVPASKGSAEKSSGQAKTPAKKGPSQTESFSMFGKKQQKQKKPGKGKGTLKGKPLERVNASGLASSSASQDVSSTATKNPAGASTSTKKPTLTVKTEADSNAPSLNSNDPDASFTSAENASTTAASGQESPSKGGIRNFFGLFGRVKSPSAAGKETSLEDVPPEDELTDSKALAADPQAVFNIDHLIQQRTFDDERTYGDKSVFTTSVNTAFNDTNDVDAGRMSVTGLGILASNSTDVKETPKKRRKKKKSKSAKQNESQRESSPGADGDADGSASVATPSARTDVTSGSYDVESDDGTDKSSTTMGRPTPPVSPVILTPGKRRRIEQRMTEEHIVSPRAPRNKHVKKKSYSRVASSTTAGPAQETPSPSTGAASEIEIEQQPRLMQVYQLRGFDHDGDSNDTVTVPQALIFSDLAADDDGNTQQVIFFLKRTVRLSNDGRRLSFYHPSKGSDADSNEEARVVEETETAEEAGSEDRRVTGGNSVAGEGSEE